MNNAPRPNPQRTRSTGCPRRLDCQRYDDCLELADQLGWNGFRCDGCDAYEQQGTEERRRDTRGLLLLVLAVLNPDTETAEPAVLGG